MGYILFKYAFTAAVIVIASEVAKRSDKLGALILALPLMTLTTMIWLFVENQGNDKIAKHAWYTFWYVVPTLPMFLLFPWLLERFGFISAMGISVVITIVCFVGFALVLRKFEITLW